MTATITMPIGVLDSMKKIVDMFINDEEKHYNECLQEDKCNAIYEQMTAGPTYAINMDLTPKHIKNHIYNDLELVNRFLHSQDLNAELYNQGYGGIE